MNDKRRGDLLAVAQLGRGAEVHRQAGVEQRVDVQVFLLEKQLQEELVEPAVDVPVDVPQVVAERVVAMLGELDRRTPALALALAFHPADEDPAADQLELLELVQELRVEQRRRAEPDGRGEAAGAVVEARTTGVMLIGHASTSASVELQGLRACDFAGVTVRVSRRGRTPRKARA